MVRTRDEAIAKLRENRDLLILAGAMEPIGLIGSFAYGTPTERSDVDIICGYDTDSHVARYLISSVVQAATGRRADVFRRSAPETWPCVLAMEVRI